MCGITGFFGQTDLDLARYYLAHKKLDHRGPDDEGFLLKNKGELTLASGDKTIAEKKVAPHLLNFQKARFCLGHHRLKIVDLSARGHQPLQSKDGRFHIIYNGEVYNHIELRQELEGLGHVFTSNSDTEVILNAFAEWQGDCFNKFNGMWALVIYDNLEKQIIFSRDRFGIKPLYYYKHLGTMYFGSELRFFKAFELPLSLNKVSAANFLAYSVIDNSNETFFSEVQSVPPASYMIYTEKGDFVSEHKYWKLNKKSDSSLSFQSAKIHWQDLFHSALELRMRSDVPVGTFLSGGLDSTSIACHLAKNFQLPNSKLESFSAVYNEVEFSEKNYIDKTLKLNQKINPHFINLNATQAQAQMNQVIEAVETPLRSLAVFSQYKLYEHVKNNSDIVVLLNGQGADETFGGYSAHYSMYFSELFKSGKLGTLIKEWTALNKQRPGENYSTLSSFAQNITPPIIKSLRSKANILPDAETSQNLFAFERNLSHSLAFDLQVSALPEYLHYEDRNSMRFSKEARLPFLDYRMVEFAFSLPSNMKIKNGINKYIVRESVSDLVPPEIVNRKDKMGFSTPQIKWERQELKEEMRNVILSPDKSDLYNQIDVENLYIDNQNEYQQKTQDVLWRIYSFKLWHQLFLN